MSFFESYKNGCLLRIKLAPNASKNSFGEGVFTDADGNEYLKASVVVVPEKGKANKELIKMLSKALKISASSLEIVGGQTDHYKKIYIDATLTEDLMQRISALKKEK